MNEEEDYYFIPCWVVSPASIAESVEAVDAPAHHSLREILALVLVCFVTGFIVFCIYAEIADALVQMTAAGWW